MSSVIQDKPERVDFLFDFFLFENILFWKGYVLTEKQNYLKNPKSIASGLSEHYAGNQSPLCCSYNLHFLSGGNRTVIGGSVLINRAGGPAAVGGPLIWNND